MKPVNQTKFGRPDGNCWTACVASILEVPIEALADLDNAHRSAAIGWENGGEFQWSLILAETHALGFTLGWIMMDNPNLPRLPPHGYSIAIGPGVGGMPHACVALDREVVHDPTPGCCGLLAIESYDVLIPVVVEEESQAQYFRRNTDPPHDRAQSEQGPLDFPR